MPSDEPLTQVTRLLELPVSDVPIAQLAEAPAPEPAKDLALRIGALRETHRRRESAPGRAPRHRA
uniref:Uncharacterized protein n=1 Tax=Janibacter limosus TaxID=53458 RepID=A0AC61U892_9MICO|nr:hypothetical protein [Janibacter limosus]